MSDVYIYFFIGLNGSVGGNALSARPATLQAIKGRGEPVMASQIVVDDTELDGEGFLVARMGSGSLSINDIAAQIGSLEMRAASRDSEAINSIDGKEKYMLRLESRELRKQARNLKSRPPGFVAAELT